MMEKNQRNGSSQELAVVASSNVATASTCNASAAADAASTKLYAYPPPLASYANVVADPRLFMDTIQKLHATLHIKFKIPIIGGNELDLHRLFVEVTSRGGIEKLIEERRWKEIISIFNFPPTATSASFLLRKYYTTILFHYERIYFFRATHFDTATPVQPPAALVSQAETNLPVEPQNQGNFSSGTRVMGVIDGEFPNGYLVTVMAGGQELQGVLFEYPLPPTDQALVSATPVADSSGANTAPLVKQHRRRRKKAEMKKKRDPEHPKQNRSGYNFFFREHYAPLRLENPGRDREISRMIGELWNNLSEAEKGVYQEIALKDKERYQAEMQRYRSRRGVVIGEPVPVQQRQSESSSEDD